MTLAEAEAEQLVVDLGLSLPIKPEQVCEQISTDELLVTYEEAPFNSSDICGLSVGHGDKIKVVVNSNIEFLGRKRFTGAHEVGHVILHIQKGLASEFTCSNTDVSGKNNANREYEKAANEFASSLLMPKSLIYNDILRNDLTWELIRGIKDKCESSLESTARRVVTVSTERCALVIHKKGEMWTPIRSSSFGGFIDSMPFPNHLEAYPDGPGLTYPDFLEECDASDWFRNNRDLPSTIRYLSIYNSEYDRRMTLLLIPEDEDDEGDEWEEPSFSY